VKLSSHKILLLLQFLVAFLVAGFMFNIINKESPSFENLALGTSTSPYQAKNKKLELIHFLHLDSLEMLSFDQLRPKLVDSICLILGNSQTHSINQMQSGEVNYVELIDRKKQNQNNVLCFSFPNANLQEQYTCLRYVLTRKKVKELVLPVFMDDLREDGIREAFFSGLMNQGFQISDKSDVSKNINQKLKRQNIVSNVASVDEKTTQERTEQFLNNYLNEHTRFWPKRENMRGSIFNWTYMLRNTVFGIRPGSVRKMIPEAYARNMHVLEEILKCAKQNNFRVYLYIPPIRSDVPLPYDLNEYQQFKEDLSDLCKNYVSVAKLKDFSQIVPAHLWGYKDPTNFIDKREIDFMHFQYKGHQILADSIWNFLNKRNK
jgi:hypothetical protein